MAYTGTGVTTPYTDTYVYSQDGDPLELLRQAQGASTATPYWYALDGQGNVAALATQSGSVVDSYSYDQWGRLLGSSESVPQQLRYKEYWYDNELQWYWLSVRAYDPALGRFLQPDPSELEGLFSYVYAADNPADSADPSGLTVTQPAPSGCLETSGDFFECNVRAGSTQWNNEITSGGAAPVAGVAGTQVASAMPNTCGDAAAVCQVDAKVERGQGADLTAEYIDRVIQAIKNIWPNIVTRGKWNKNPKEAADTYLGTAIHTGIARFYLENNPEDEPIYTNYTPVRTILKLAYSIENAPLSNKRLSSRPDILNVPRGYIYEIKRYPSYRAAATEVTWYLNSFRMAGIEDLQRGPVNAPGVAGIISAPGGYAVFFSPAPGIILYRNFRGDFKPRPGVEEASDAAAAAAAIQAAAAIIGSIAGGILNPEPLPAPA